MVFRRDKDKLKTCPRCDMKVPEFTEICPDCGLDFARLDKATNADAKRKKLRGDRDFIIMTAKLPHDVSFLKLILLCIFLGPVGAHNFYVGRYLKGSVLLADFVIALLLVIFNEPLMSALGEQPFSAISTILGLIMLMWFWDLLQIITKKYKVPVAIDLDYQNDDFQLNNKIDESQISDVEENNTIEVSKENDIEENIKENTNNNSDNLNTRTENIENNDLESTSVIEGESEIENKQINSMEENIVDDKMVNTNKESKSKNKKISKDNR